MTDSLTEDLTAEVVAVYADKVGLDHAVAALLAGGFERSDLSVLGTHDSLDVMNPTEGGVTASLPTLIAGETQFLGLVAAAGMILLVSGPWGGIAAAVAGLAGGAIALEPLLDRMTQSAHAKGFAEALRAGHILLWVRTKDVASVSRAEATLRASGGISLSRLPPPSHEVIVPPV